MTLATRDAFRRLRRLLMATEGLSEDESVGVDFGGMTQMVDGDWGVHAIRKKSLFASVA